MRTIARLLICAMALGLALVFISNPARIHTHGPLRAGTPAQITQSTAGPCAARADKQLEQQQDPDTDTPPVVASSPLVCELGDAVVLEDGSRFCGHIVTDETRDDRAFNPCAPARAGPKL